MLFWPGCCWTWLLSPLQSRKMGKPRPVHMQGVEKQFERFGSSNKQLLILGPAYKTAATHYGACVLLACWWCLCSVILALPLVGHPSTCIMQAKPTVLLTLPPSPRLRCQDTLTC